MQKTLSELLTLPEAELVRLFEHDPVLVTQNGEPKFVAQSLDSFEAMVRRIRQLEANSKRQASLGKLVFIRS
jgi:prevent-host-death family protein